MFIFSKRSSAAFIFAGFNCDEFLETQVGRDARVTSQTHVLQAIKRGYDQARVSLDWKLKFKQIKLSAEDLQNYITTAIDLYAIVSTCTALAQHSSPLGAQMILSHGVTDGMLATAQRVLATYKLPTDVVTAIKMRLDPIRLDDGTLVCFMPDHLLRGDKLWSTEMNRLMLFDGTAADIVSVLSSMYPTPLQPSVRINALDAIVMLNSDKLYVERYMYGPKRELTANEASDKFSRTKARVDKFLQEHVGTKLTEVKKLAAEQFKEDSDAQRLVAVLQSDGSFKLNPFITDTTQDLLTNPQPKWSKTDLWWPKSLEILINSGIFRGMLLDGGKNVTKVSLGDVAMVDEIKSTSVTSDNRLAVVKSVLGFYSVFEMPPYYYAQYCEHYGLEDMNITQVYESTWWEDAFSKTSGNKPEVERKFKKHGTNRSKPEPEPQPNE